LASRCMMAFDQGDEISYSKNAKASLEFLEKHLGTWIPKFFVRMAEFHHVDYYSHVSYLLINFIVEDKILLRDDIECIRGIDV
ncbi:MAG: hypothetical protein RR505_13615, partial [Raoultibacter sp.]